MAAPTVTIKANQGLENGYGKHDRNPSWTVAFSCYSEPSSSYTASGAQNQSHIADAPKLHESEPLIIVQNDCISVNINNSKSSFAKTASLTMKITDIWYSRSVSPGDWVFIWMTDNQTDQDALQAALASLQANFTGTSSSIFNGYKSGLKFIGRVISVSESDTVSNGGRTVTQNIQCQAFVEMATSVYQTYIAASILNPFIATPSGQSAYSEADKKTVEIASAQNFANSTINAAVAGGMATQLTAILGNPSTKFAPDTIIGQMLILTMGISRKDTVINEFPIPGTFNDAITLPANVSALTINRNNAKLWQMYNIILGIQKYSGGNAGSIGARMSPKLTSSQAGQVIYTTDTRCKGHIPFIPPTWDNSSIWSILSQYLNPVVNEMYTCFRINQFGRIAPHVIVREVPLSTGLYNYLTPEEIKAKPLESKESANPDTNSSKLQPQQTDDQPQLDKGAVLDVAQYKAEFKKTTETRTMYHDLPRWKIDESMLLSVNVSTSESKRINFVQVWGRSHDSNLQGSDSVPAQMLQQQQILKGNFYADVADISRHGLRASITESAFDVYPLIGTFQSPNWARMRADWMFNGHLKLEGTITCVGIQDPICEGDNLEVRGMLYHIEGVSHSGNISGNGTKSFITTIQVSNGILASTGAKGQPLYACHQNKTRHGNVSPGFTEVQTRSGSDQRDSDGELKPKTKK